MPLVLYYPGSSGYFLQARSEASDLREFLRDYESLLSKEDVLHIGTHPPGITVSLRVLLGACRQIPALRTALIWSEPPIVKEEMGRIRANAGTRGGRLSEADEACLWGAAYLVELTFLLGAWFLYLLLRVEQPAHVAWRIAALWPLLPGAMVFFPKSDLIFPSLALAVACAWFHGLKRRSLWLCLLAGLFAWGGMMLSLAMAPALILIVLATLWMRPWKQGAEFQTNSPRSFVTMIGGAALGYVIPSVAIWLWSGLNVLAVWSWNFHNHSLFYVHYERTWWAWLLVNPLEFSLTLGLPIMAFLVFGSARPRGRTQRSLSGGLLLAWCVVLGGLWLSSKNMGEAARLWLVFTPWPLLGLVPVVKPASGEAERFDHQRFVWLALLISQALCCLLTLTRVDGFQFDQFGGS